MDKETMLAILEKGLKNHQSRIMDDRVDRQFRDLLYLAGKETGSNYAGDKILRDLESRFDVEVENAEQAARDLINKWYE